MKRRMIELDDDGDVVMAANMKQRKARGGKRARRKRQKGGNGADIEMKDAEVQPMSDPPHPPPFPHIPPRV